MRIMEGKERDCKKDEESGVDLCHSNNRLSWQNWSLGIYTGWETLLPFHVILQLWKHIAIRDYWYETLHLFWTLRFIICCMSFTVSPHCACLHCVWILSFRLFIVNLDWKKGFWCFRHNFSLIIKRNYTSIL